MNDELKGKKYLIDGRAVIVHKDLGEIGFLVSNVLQQSNQDHEGEYYTEEYESEMQYVVDAVFDSAPTEVYDQRILLLEAKIKELNEQKNSLYMSVLDEKKLVADREKRMAKFHKLDLLDKLIKNEVTHLVIVEGYCPKIVKFEEEIKSTKRYDKSLKLLTLFGDTKGDLNWRMSHYSDGSGTSKEVIPASSEEDAIKISKGIVADSVATLPDVLRNNGYYFNTIVEQALEHSVTVPQEFIDVYNKNKEDIRNKSIQHHISKISDAESALKELGYYGNVV